MEHDMGKCCKDHLGNEYKSITEMCDAYGVERTTYRRRLTLGWTIEEALTNSKKRILPNSNACFDHLGVRYNSETEMCHEYNIDYELYRCRKRLGWSFEEIISGKKKNARVKEQVDYLGNIYSSETAMCNAHNVNRNTYRVRIAHGWTKKEALTGQRERGGLSDLEPKKTTYDHLGNPFRSKHDMCAAYGINVSTFKSRVQSGYSLEEALTGVKHVVITNGLSSVEQRISISRGNKKRCLDHLGNEYESEAQMCEAYNVSQVTYQNRLFRLGWTLEDALTRSVTNYVCDHTGKKYESARKMCEHYGVRFDVFFRRRKLGWTLEEALTDSKEHTLPNATNCQDHKGNSFLSYNQMCKYWGIDFNVFRDRIGKLGWTLEEALTIPKSYSLGEYRVSVVLEKLNKEGLIESFFHNITIKKTFLLLNMSAEYGSFMNQYEKELKERNINISKEQLSHFRFDFTLVKDGGLFAFIEFDGEQHFTYVDIFFKTIGNFIYRYHSDLAKNIFTESNQIPLLRIRFDQGDLKTIEYMIRDLIDDPIKYTKIHNTYIDESVYYELFKGREGFLYPCFNE